MAKEKGGKAENFFVLDTKEATYKKGKGTKGAINIADLKSSIFDLENAINIVARNTAPIEKTKISKYSELSVDEQVNKAVDALITCLSSEKKIIAGYKEEIQEIKKTIKKWNQEGNNIKSLKKSAVKALESGNKEVAIKKLNKLEKHGKSELVTKLLKEAGYKAVYKSNAKSVFVIASIKKIKSKKEKQKQKKDNTSKAATVAVASTVSKASTSNKATKATNAKVVKKTTSKATTVASLKKKLKKALKKGDASAVSAYTLLASAIGKKKAKAYANKLGYNVKYKDNKAVALNKIKEEKEILNVGQDGNKDKNTTNNNNTTTTDKNENRKPSNTIDRNNTDINNNNNNNNNLNNNQDNKNDVVASVDEGNNGTNTTPEPPSTPPENNNTTSTNNTNSSSTNYTRGEASTGNNSSANSATVVEENENISDTQGGNVEDDLPADLDDDFEELPKKENKVTTIDTDTEVEEKKKSGGLGAAVPLGLGTIVTGAAAVAGVRYLKNRNNSEDYDDSEDYDEDSQYIDSAQYSSDDDEYSGPAGSVYTDVSESSVDDLYTDNVKEESYIDPEDLEEEDDDDFSNDKAFEEINSNFN